MLVTSPPHPTNVSLNKDNALKNLKSQFKVGRRKDIFEKQIENTNQDEIFDMITYISGYNDSEKRDLIQYQLNLEREIEGLQKELKELTRSKPTLANDHSKIVYLCKIQELASEISELFFNCRFIIVSKSPKKLFCRPSCPAREANVESMDFPLNISSAIFEYDASPCGRCMPMNPAYRPSIVKLAETFNFMRKRKWNSILEEQAEFACLSKHHFNRKFKEFYTLPPDKLQKTMVRGERNKVKDHNVKTSPVNIPQTNFDKAKVKSNTMVDRYSITPEKHSCSFLTYEPSTTSMNISDTLLNFQLPDISLASYQFPCSSNINEYLTSDSSSSVLTDSIRSFAFNSSSYFENTSSELTPSSEDSRMNLTPNSSNSFININIYTEPEHVSDSPIEYLNWSLHHNQISFAQNIDPKDIYI